MAREVVLTPTAKLDYYNVLDYLLFEWGDIAADNFIDRFEKVILLLATDTSIFQYFDISQKIQKCVLTRHNVLYFRATDEQVLVLMIFDTRQNPEKLNF
ncbi:type II toxin-antitoxin system RelE/ParE family toxin [Mucilaginibacter sp. dw_454]|uniref:type II toxin-antitoxin system RelE/ParE family toxin n=1 Tax=Mucilaginibacter sp. dw_454 TaxID=2720079 RepID=UPI001BD62EB5|nr:type II toxin-antitoxin system RelE/ParE family toxin [Mucilaginibacter sp. dw_454]